MRNASSFAFVFLSTSFFAFACAHSGDTDTGSTGYDASTPDGDSAAPAPPAEGGTLGVSVPANVSLVQGVSTPVTVTITRGAYAGPIAVTISGAVGVTAAPLTIAEGASSGQLGVVITGSVSQGPLPAGITVLASSVPAGGPSGSVALTGLIRGGPGALDTSFGKSGSSPAIFPTAAKLHSIAVQADDGIIAVGESAISVGSADSYAAIARLTKDGAIDPSFAGVGYEVLNFPTASASSAMLVGAYAEPGGKIAICGTETLPLYHTFFGSRLSATGVPDATYGTSGTWISITTSPNIDVTATACATNSVDDMLVVGGWTDSTNSTYTWITDRRDPNGTDLDYVYGTYKTDGIDPNTYAYGAGVVADSSGNTFVAALTTNGTGASHTELPIVAKISGAALDTTFTDDHGTPGEASISFTPGQLQNFAQVYGVAVQKDGRVVVAGQEIGGTVHVKVARYLTTGAPDTTFGTSGLSTTFTATSERNYANVVMQADGKILVATRVSNGGRNDMAVIRLNTDGSVDSTFGQSGIASPQIGSGSTPQGIALQSDGRILLAGWSDDGTKTDFAVARFWP